jgi:inosine-uridine nucleoside N-ribohydrolase
MSQRLWVVGLLVACFAGTPLFAETPVRKISLKEYRDKMQGGWLGQMAGVGWGQPTEFKVRGTIIPEDKMPAWQPAMINQHNNDDCYVEMTFLKTLEDYGLDVGIRQAGIDFANSGYPLWHANKFGRENLWKGIAPPDSGHPRFTAHADDIDYQIEADFAGIISPGMPSQAIALGELFGHLMNYGDGVYAGQFVAALYSEAYFESDVSQLIRNALRCIPSQSQYAEMVRDMLQWHQENPTDWQKTWQLVENKYHKDPKYTHGLCSKAGGEKASSIDVKLNGAYILMGLLYGGGDPDKTIVISCRCGQDSDCNPSNAAGVLFTVMGAARIPPRFLEKLDLGRKFSHSQYTLPKVYEVSEQLTRAAVVRAGGRIERDAQGQEVFVIPVQTPKPSALESSCAPGPIANSRFTAEEMAKIKPVAVEPAKKAGVRIPVILDTDIGDDIDDTWALAMLLKSPQFDLKLVTTTCGRAEYRAKLIARLLTVAGRTDVAVGLGEGTRQGEGKQAPWVADYQLSTYPGKVHKDGVGAVIDVIEKSSQPVTIIAIGPLDTLAALVQRRPDLVSKVSFAGMHGSVRVGYGGSKKTSAEWNVKANSAAAKAVLSAPWRHIAITPLDTCGLVKLSGERFAAMKASHDPLAQAVLENYRIWARKDKLDQLTVSTVLFDCVAVYLARPDAQTLLELETLSIAVTPDGFTKIDPAGKSMSVASQWKDLDAFDDLLVKILLGP